MLPIASLHRDAVCARHAWNNDACVYHMRSMVAVTATSAGVVFAAVLVGMVAVICSSYFLEVHAPVILDFGFQNQ